MIDRVNDLEVVAMVPVGGLHDNPRQALVVCDKGPDKHQRWVCWRVQVWDGTRGEQEGVEAMWGYYTDDLRDAINDMIDRAGYARAEHGRVVS